LFSDAKKLWLAVLLVVMMPRRGSAENWPQWRGPNGDGTTTERAIPTEWDGKSGKNIRWNTAIPGKGHSSPIVWEDRLFVTTCIEDERARLLICLDAEDGVEKWRTTILEAPLETLHKLNSHASGTPATDGQMVYVPFLKPDGATVPAPNVGSPRQITPGRIQLSAIDFDGKLQWQADLGEFISAHGFCSCPIFYKHLVILNGDHDGDGYVVALDKKTGKTVWRIAREQGIRSYVTPIIRTIDGQDQMVMSGSGHVASFDPANGKMIWKVEGPTEQFVASMVFDGERFLLAAGFPTYHVMAIRPDGRGDVSASHVAWHVDSQVRCYVPSPVLIGRRLLVADDRGTASCFDSLDGTRLWNGRLAGGFHASLVATERLAYFLSTEGVMKVIDPAKDFAILAENELGQRCHASPAISNGCLYLRSDSHLFCIADAVKSAE